MKKNVLVLFERSGAVSVPFREAGFNVITVDILPHLVDNSHHIMCDIFNLDNFIKDYTVFDLLIAFPPCTYFSKAGLHWLYKQPGRRDLQLRDLSLIKYLWSLPIKYKCFENPGGSALNKLFFKCNCKIDYCEFDINFKKPTCLWLDNLPPLLPLFCNYKKYGNFITSMSYTSYRRNITPMAVGYAMVSQWSYLFE